MQTAYRIATNSKATTAHPALGHRPMPMKEWPDRPKRGLIDRLWGRK